MKTIKIIALYLLVVFFLFMGSMHFIQPEEYYAMIPSCLPFHSLLVAMSGIIEITLAILLIPIKTRAISAKLISCMLLVFFFAIHIPQSIDYYKTSSENFVDSIIRLAIQFLFIAWAWIFTKEK